MRWFAGPYHSAAMSFADVRTKTGSLGSVFPALRVREQEIAENLNTCDRTELFRIHEIGVERGCVAFAEKSHQIFVTLDEIVGEC